MNIDIGTGHATGHLHCLNGNRARARGRRLSSLSFNPSPSSPRAGLTVHSPSGKRGRNMASRRPEDFEVK